MRVMRVLIVDDNQDILDILEMIIEESGHLTKAINNGNDFFRSVTEFQPDLILLDIMLGKHDGRQLCAKLKSDDGMSHIPIVMISASHSRVDLDKKKCRHDGFIPKPFDISEVSRIVNSFI